MPVMAQLMSRRKVASSVRSQAKVQARSASSKSVSVRKGALAKGAESNDGVTSGAWGSAPNVDRLSRLRRLFDREALTHMLVTSPEDVAYLTGFHGGDSYLLVPASERARATILSDFRYTEELEPQRATFEVVIRTQGMHAALIQMLKDANVSRLGVQGEIMTVGELRSLEHSMAGTVTKISETKGFVSQLRVRKDAGEIATIRKAISIQQAALKAVLPTIKAGQTELQVAAALESAMKIRGSSTPAFESIVAALANGSLPHYRPQAIKLKKNQPLLIDWGAVYQGYRGDMTRTFCLGKWPAKIEEIYKIVLEAHKLAAAGLRAGASTKAVDAIARSYITKHGYGDQFGHGLGHGLGLHTHEDPSLSHRAPEMMLQPGMVVTIEPGIYLPGVGGVRIEDDYVVTETGSENLCSLPKDIKWATL